MKLNTRKHLNQRGFVHHIIPILAFVVLFGVIGAYFLLRARAATPQYRYESTSNSSYCISNNGGAAQLRACSNAVSNATVTSIGVSNAYYISIGGRCLSVSGNYGLTFVAAACHDTTAEEWSVSGSQLRSLGYLDKGQYYCISSKTANGALNLQSCGASGYYQGWRKVQAPGSVSTGGGGSSIGTFSGVSNPHCYGTTYTSANVNTAYKCVAAIQQMISAMDYWDHYNGGNFIGVDGQYGSTTTAAVKAYQSYEKISADGKVGPQTWHYLCWSIWNRRQDTGHGNTSTAWTYAGCNSPASEHSTPAGKTNLR